MGQVDQYGGEVLQFGNHGVTGSTGFGIQGVIPYPSNVIRLTNPQFFRVVWSSRKLDILYYARVVIISGTL